MPHIVIYCPPLGKEKKAATVKAVTEAFAKTSGHEMDIISVHIHEFSYSNIGVGGQLLADILDPRQVEEREKLLYD